MTTSLIYKLLCISSLLVLTASTVTINQVYNQSASNQCKVSDNLRTLHLLALGPFPDPDADPGPGWDAAPAFIPAARLAVELINNRSDILPDYQLELLEGDSGCNLEDRAFVSFVDNIFFPCKDKTVVGIIGPGCAGATLALAPLTVHESLNIMLMSITTTPLINGNLMKHKNTFRTVTSSLNYIDAFENIIVRQKWTRVAALYDNLREFHIATYNEFRERIGSQLPLFSAGIEDQVLPGVLEDLMRNGIRIAFVFAGRGLARSVMCAAFHRGLTFPSYQWFFTDRVLADFTVSVSFSFGQDTISCTPDQMALALNGSILSINQFRRQDQLSNDTAAQLSYVEYERLYNETLNDYLIEINLTRSDFAATAFNYFNAYFDATWALALSLNNSVEELQSKGYNLSYHYHYNRPSTKEVGDIVRSNLVNLTFEGMGGTIRFDSKRHDVSSIGIDFYQIGYDEESKQATQYRAGVFKPLNINENAILIDDEFKNVITRVPIGISIFFSVVTIIVTLLTASLQIAVICYAEKKSVKASSPHLNHLIFSGCYLCSLASLVFISQDLFALKIASNQVLYGVICSMIFWTTSFAFSLVFGTVSGKTWRIYRIFTHFSQEKVKWVSDTHLVSFVVALISIDMLILCIWNSINPWRLSEQFEITDDQKQQTRYNCACDNFIVWSGVILGIKGMIAAIAVYLSILTRQVHRKEYNMTQNINIFIYSLILLYAFGIAIVFFTNSNNPIVSFITSNIMLNLTVILTCSSLILPPLLAVKNFWGSKVLARSRTIKNDLTTQLSSVTFTNIAVVQVPKNTNSDFPVLQRRRSVTFNLDDSPVSQSNNN